MQASTLVITSQLILLCWTSSYEAHGEHLDGIPASSIDPCNTPNVHRKTQEYVTDLISIESLSRPVAQGHSVYHLRA
jgi:hypothetical protein